MMRVDVHIGDAAHAVVTQAEHRKHWIVEVTKPVGTVRHAVVRAACWVIDHAALCQQFTCQDVPLGQGGGFRAGRGDVLRRRQPAQCPRQIQHR